MKRFLKYSPKSFLSNSRLGQEKGMTLIEIMIVLIILAGVMSLVGQTVFKNFRKAQTQQVKIQIGEVMKSLEMYYTDCGSYPSTEIGLNALLEAPADCKNWGPEAYTKKQNLKDPWKQDFIYESSGNGYEIKSLGGDKKEGGSGNDMDVSSKEL